MENTEKGKNWPVGTGEKFFKERAKERLPALEVKNTVTWVNPAFKEAPFRLKLGKPTDLGIFFTPQPEEYPEEKVRKPIIMREWGKGRSGLLGSAVFRDKESRLYRDVDVKGIGVFQRNPTAVLDVQPKSGEHAHEAFGLMDDDYARIDRNNSEKFLKAGIRTHRVVAISDLEEIIDAEGKKISIAEGKRRGIIPPEMNPVVQVRAFGTKERIGYLRDFGGPARQTVLDDAKALVAQEQSRDPGNFSMGEYLKWFAEALGVQVAKMRKLKVFHGYLTGHNITLDCRIVDLDSVKPIGVARLFRDEALKINTTYEQLYENDKVDARFSLESMLIEALGGSVARGHFVELFEAAYERELDTKRKRGLRNQGG
ncbi:MAG: hypothetical protein HYW90_04215 [Candidatus Sungbacteria bacterium]|nr:hypothetical protein [Candidatus Sungbacteria bacterium]